MKKRTEELCKRFDDIKIDAMLITDEYNYRYLSGFSGSNATLLIHPSESLLVTDFRYKEQSVKQAPDFTVEITSQFVDQYDPIIAMIARYGIKSVGFESDKVTVDQLDKLKKLLAGINFVPAAGIVEKIREIKDPSEVENITKAQRVAEKALDAVIPLIKPGIREMDISAELTYVMAKNGCIPSFNNIVASGPNSSMPHAGVSDRMICNGDFVTMDFGALYNGYCSDMTRTVAVGNITDEMKKVYGIVLEAQKRALEMIRPGVKCKDIDFAARGFIADNGYGDYFGHGLGHGLGLFIHENPRFSYATDEITREGVCISVEPGIYLPGKFGVRIEDIVYITENGYNNFTKAQKELIIL